MECPVCHSSNQPGQKFCGSCGHKLEKDCTQCGATNPPAYNFCGQCGRCLATSGALSLVRSGIIAEIDQKAAALLGYPGEEMAGKPFSMFVVREDLAVFFSHWNELLSTGEKQTVELALKHKNGKKIYVLIEYTLDEIPAPQAQLIHLSLNDESKRRLALDQLQYQQDLLHLIHSLADNLHSVSGRHLDSAVTGALKKVCLFTKADRCFIYSINRNQKRLEIRHQWCQPSCPGGVSKSKVVPLVMIKRSIVRLRREHAFIIGNVSKLPPSERYELLAWHHADLEAVMCHLIYSRGRPIGVIGVARNQTSGEWTPDCIGLVKLCGQLVSGLLPFGAEEIKSAKGGRVRDTKHPDRNKTPEGKAPAAIQADSAGGMDGDKQVAGPQRKPSSDRNLRPDAVRPLPDVGKPMQLEKLSDDQSLDQQTVFLRDDGLILLTCPYCGTQETTSISQFEKLGNAIMAQCPCHERFAAVLEKRRAHRKSVNLEGYFTIAGEFGPNDAKGSIWGPMVVRNLSKTGLRFFSKRVDLIRPGDFLMVRFNLDNSNKALIHKQAEVIAIHEQEVGCRFKGADQYDITLGFYFI